MEKAKLAVMRFDNSDVITASGDSFTFADLFDGTANNATIKGTYNGKNVDITNTSGNERLSKDLAAILNIEKDTKVYNSFVYSGEGKIAFATLFSSNNTKGRGDNGDNIPELAVVWNGVYQWVEGKFEKIQ